MSPEPTTQRLNRPILVTGAHRSGTTWVGKMLAASDEVAYISEPLNTLHRPGVLRTPIELWYTYIGPHNQQELLPALRETLTFHYHTWAEIKSLRSVKDFLRMGRDWKTFTIGKVGRKRPLLKDPFAVFSAPWFNQKLDCQVVITVRHPAAVASSLKRLNWSFEFGDILSQPQLMDDWLAPFRGDMENMAEIPDDIIAQSSLLWRMIYHTVWQYQQDDPQIQVLRHEDLSVDPTEGFKTLYRQLGLTFSAQVEETIRQSSGAGNPKERSKRAVHSVHLNSWANIHNWKHRLNTEEIARIKEMTADVASRYYAEEDWN